MGLGSLVPVCFDHKWDYSNRATPGSIENDLMSADFLKCVRDGGRVRTETLSGGKYIKLCYLNGESHAGEVHTKKSGGSAGRSLLRGK